MAQPEERKSAPLSHASTAGASPKDDDADGGDHGGPSSPSDSGSDGDGIVQRWRQGRRRHPEPSATENPVPVRLLAQLVDPLLATIPPVNAVHPLWDAIATGSSRSLYLWGPKDDGAAAGRRGPSWTASSLTREAYQKRWGWRGGRDCGERREGEPQLGALPLLPGVRGAAGGGVSESSGDESDATSAPDDGAFGSPGAGARRRRGRGGAAGSLHPNAKAAAPSRSDGDRGRAQATPRKRATPSKAATAGVSAEPAPLFASASATPRARRSRAPAHPGLGEELGSTTGLDPQLLLDDATAGRRGTAHASGHGLAAAAPRHRDLTERGDSLATMPLVAEAAAAEAVALRTATRSGPTPPRRLASAGGAGAHAEEAAESPSRAAAFATSPFFSRPRQEVPASPVWRSAAAPSLVPAAAAPAQPQPPPRLVSPFFSRAPPEQQQVQRPALPGAAHTPDGAPPH